MSTRLLHKASIEGDLDVIKSILSKGKINVNARDI